ncbi:MAG: ABC transporter substrate-binding protein [Campylobacterota bacterium]|nr:ABC transporter substrate-binding protein [Campylobacterota bacterium]
MMKIKLIILLLLVYSTIYAKEKVSLQLLWKHQFEFAGYYIAKEKGFYDDYNIDLEIKEFEFGTHITDDIQNGKTTFGIGYPNIILDKANGANIVLLNAIFQSSPHILVTLKSSNINKIDDFKNRSIKIDNDAIKTAPLLSILFANKIKLEDMNRVDLSFDINDLIDKKVDISTAYLSNEIYKLKQQKIEYNIFNPKDYGFDFYNNLLFTSQNTVKKKPEMVKNFQTATLQGWEYAFENIDETIELITKKYNTQNKTKGALYYEAKILKKLAYQNNIPLGEITKNKLQRIYDIYNLMGLTKSSIDFDNFIFKDNKIYFSKEEKEFIKNNIINTSVSKNWKPFTFQDSNGAIAGISTDYWKLILEKSGLKSQYHLEDKFTEQLNTIKNKTNDIIYSTGKTTEREKYSIFSQEYINFPLSIVTLKDENYIEDGSYLLDKKIAVGENYTAHKLLKKQYPNMDFVFVDSIEDGLKLVDSKDVYAFVDLKPILSYNINKLGFNNLKISGNTGLDFGLRIMIRDDYKILQSILNKTIKEISPQEINNIIKKWENIQFDKKFDYQNLYRVIIFFFIIVIFILYRHYLLNKSNQDLQIAVDKKTKELKKLNKNLEKRIKEAIKENSQKDTILFSQSKMAAMGEMIGNIAHQWRQPLSIISTTASGLQIQIEYDMFKKDEAIKNLDSLVDATKYLSQTIDDFQDFLKPTKKSHIFNAKDVIDKNIDMFGKSFINNNIEFIISAEDISIDGNENELFQVVINILNNAKDAFKDKNMDNKLIFISLFKKENKLILNIKDNAGGIPQNILGNIFEPYFTTKHKSQGTGIGLYMSFQIISNTFNGTLVASNEQYNYENNTYTGALFSITLPLS